MEQKEEILKNKITLDNIFSISLNVVKKKTLVSQQPMVQKSGKMQRLLKKVALSSPLNSYHVRFRGM